MFENIKAIIFDCDGTLVHSERLHFEAWKHALQLQGFALTEHLYIQKFIGFCDILLSKMTVGLLGFDRSEIIFKTKNEYYIDKLDTIEPIDSTVTFLKQLIHDKERKGLKLAVASAAPKHEIIQNLQKLHVANNLDAVVSGVDDLTEYSDSEGTNKPKPYIYLKTARLLGLQPNQCMAIEDSRSGISAAVSAGCFAIAVPNEFTKHQDLSHAHLKIESLDSLHFNQESFLL